MTTACTLSKACGADSSDATVGIDLLTGETEHVEVLADSAYGSGIARATRDHARATVVTGAPRPWRGASAHPSMTGT